jgi:hypothetical protein
LFALALIHAALIAHLARMQWTRIRAGAEGDTFVTEVFFLTEAEPKIEEPAPAQPLERAARSSTRSVRTAPITLPPEAPTQEPSPERPRVDWAREAELSASRQLQKDDDAKRRAAPFAHDFSAPEPNRPTPQFRWSTAHTQRVQPLEGGGTLIRLNERCALVLSGFLFPVCSVGKIPVHGDLFDHMNDPPVLGEAPRPP